MRAGFFISILLGLSLSFSVTAKDTNKKVTTFKWSVVHAPLDYFLNSAKKFKSIIEKKTDGRVKIEIIPHPVKIYSDVERHRVPNLERVQSGEVDIAQLYSHTIAKKINPEFKVYELPFIFRDNNHITNIVEGRLGNELLASMEKSGLKGLGYTYCGGLMSMLTAGEEIKGVEFFRDKRVGATWSQTRNQMFRDVGSYTVRYQSPYKKRINSREALTKNLADFKEISLADYSRVILKDDFDVKESSKHGFAVTETNHTLLLTILFMNQKKLNELNKNDKKIFLETAKLIAREEREQVVADSNKAKNKMFELGMKIHILSDDAKAKWKKASKETYERFKRQVPRGAKLITEIEKN